MLISMCFSVDSSSPNGGDHPQKVGFDDYGMPIPSASAVSKLTTQQWRSMRKSTRDHVFDVPCSCRKQMLVLCQSQSCYPFSRDSWYDNDNHDDNEEAHNFHLRHRYLIIQMETITHFYIALFFSSCTFQTEKNISKTCTLSLFTLFRILLSIAPYAHFPSWILVYYWRSTISIVHHKFWQDFESHVFAQIADVTVGAFQFLCNTATNPHNSPCCLAGITGKFFGHLSSIAQTVVVSCYPRFICRSSTNVNFPWTRQKFFQTCRPIDVPCVSTVTSLQEHSKQSVRQFKVGQMQSYQQKKWISTFAWYPLITKHKSCGNSTHFQWEEHLLHEKFSAKVQKFAPGQEVFGCDKSDSYRPSGKAHRGTSLASPADPYNPRKLEFPHPIDFGWLIRILIFLS